jgi:hypothetical protein
MQSFILTEDMKFGTAMTQANEGVPYPDYITEVCDPMN